MSDLPSHIGSYEIKREIGRGAVGAVYEGFAPTSRQRVAIRVFPGGVLGNDDARQRFERDLRAISSLRHRNVVRVIEHGWEGELIYVVMEYVEGSSLEQFLRHRRISLQESLAVFREVCLAVESAHRANITHRAINARNVFVSSDLTRVQLADFGMGFSEILTPDDTQEATIVSGRTALEFIAPEQRVAPQEADRRSDIYSLGVLFYFLLTGGTRGFNLPSRVNSEVPPEVDPMVMKCLATDPRQRYQSADQLIREVEALQQKLHFRLAEELKGISKSTSHVFRASARAFSSRNTILALVGGLILVVLLLIVAWQLVS